MALTKTTTGQSTRHVNSMAYARESCGETWSKQDEKDMAADTARNSHVAFVEAYRLNQQGLHNRKQMAEAFGFNPHMPTPEPTPGTLGREERIKQLLGAAKKDAGSAPASETIQRTRSLRRSQLDEAISPGY